MPTKQHRVLDVGVQVVSRHDSQAPCESTRNGMDTPIRPSYKRAAQIAYDSGMTSKEACFMFNLRYNSLMRAASSLGISLKSNGMGRPPAKKTNLTPWNK